MYPQTSTSSLCCNQSVPLSDLDFIARRLSLFWGNEWAQMIEKVTQRVAWNENIGETSNFVEATLKVLYPPNWGSPVTYQEVEKTISAYINDFEQNDSPSYLPSKADDAYLSNMSKLSSVNKASVKKILDQLYFGTKDGSIKSDRFLYPANRQYDKMKEIPDSADAVKNPLTGAFNGLGWVLSNAGWILPTALIGAGLFIAYPYLKTAQEYTKK